MAEDDTTDSVAEDEPKAPSSGPGTPDNPKPRIKDLERPRLSASSISTYRQCPKQWYFKYMVGMPTGVGYEALVGSFIHQVFEDIYTLEPEERTPAAAKEMLKEGWGKFYDETFDVLSDQGVVIPSESELKKFTADRTKTLWQIEEPVTINVVKNELELDVDVEGVHLYGFIDRVETVDDSIVIGDYKTGKMGGDSYLPDKVNQILLYGVGYLYQEGVQAKAGRLIFLRDGIVEIEYTPESMEETIKFLKRNETRIKKTIQCKSADEVKPKTGPLCEWCQFIQLCPQGQEAFAKRRAEGRSRSDAPGYKLLGIQP